MTFLELMAYALLWTVGVYLGARLISAAYFQSKQQHERMKDGTQNNKP